MILLGDFAAGSTLRFMWTTHATDGSSVTRATNGTVRVYKNGSAIERASSAGITDTEDFDSLTGVHYCAIDLSDNTDAGFYASGNDYIVVLAGAVIDSKAINAPIAQFSIDKLSVYQAKVWLVDDNVGTTDHYEVCWFRQGVPIFTGITSPTIQVIKASDGSDLIASSSMTQISTTGLYRYDATSSARIADGAAYVVKVAASIDGSTRTWVQPMSRDS